MHSTYSSFLSMYTLKITKATFLEKKVLRLLKFWFNNFFFFLKGGSVMKPVTLSSVLILGSPSPSRWWEMWWEKLNNKWKENGGYASTITNVQRYQDTFPCTKPLTQRRAWWVRKWLESGLFNLDPL